MVHRHPSHRSSDQQYVVGPRKSVVLIPPDPIFQLFYGERLGIDIHGEHARLSGGNFAALFQTFLKVVGRRHGPGCRRLGRAACQIWWSSEMVYWRTAGGPVTSLTGCMAGSRPWTSSERAATAPQWIVSWTPPRPSMFSTGQACSQWKVSCAAHGVLLFTSGIDVKGRLSDVRHWCQGAAEQVGSGLRALDLQLLARTDGSSSPRWPRR